MPDPVLHAVAGNVATVTFHRPEALNAADASLKAAFLTVHSPPGKPQLGCTGAYVTGDDYSIADMACLSWLITHKAQGVTLGEPGAGSARRPSS